MDIHYHSRTERNRSVVLLAGLLAGLALVAPLPACTTMVVGKAATTDGSVMVTHSDDGLGDGRIVYVPAKDWAPGSQRPVYYADCALGTKPEWGGSPSHRLVDPSRAPAYGTAAPGGDRSTIQLGSIPQVPHTYAYLDGNYGIINEHQLSIGECTDKAKEDGVQPEPGKRIFYSAELSRVALERCTTAREAILLMGSLIERYGYYGTGETLTVADPQEGWVMEMCGYDPEGNSGVWVAQRVPDDGYFVAANQFRIREIQPGNPDQLYSANIFEAARSRGWWKPSDGALDWTSIYGDGEYHHPYYSLRRVWRAQSLAAPSLGLSPWVEGPFTRAYPFAIKPDRKLGVQDLVAIHSDNYEGTQFDMTKGLAAGPFGDPNRFEGGAESLAASEGSLSEIQGEFERPINIYRCAYSYINQSRSWLPDEVGALCWYGADRPATSVFMPFYPGAGSLPRSVQTADLFKLDRASMWTAFNYVANQAQLKYSFMIKDIRALRTEFAASFALSQIGLEAKAAALVLSGDRAGGASLLSSHAESIAAQVLERWWQLSEELYVRYNDGYFNTPGKPGQTVFYPAWWLRLAGYEEGPRSYTEPAAKRAP